MKPKLGAWLLRRWKIGIGTVLAAGLLAWWFNDSDVPVNEATFAVRRGDLPISVLEGGSIEAREAQEIRSEIKGYQGTKILSIVEEGYMVTEEDVKNGKILVELDSSDIKQRMTTQDIQFQSTLASLTEAKQAYEIQLNQSKTDIKAAEQKARFALMDIEKFLGDQVTREVLAQLGLPNQKTAIESYVPPNTLAPKIKIVPDLSSPSGIQLASVSNGHPAVISEAAPAPLGGKPEQLHTDRPPGHPLSARPGESGSTPRSARTVAEIDFSQYAKAELLGDGEAKQKIRKVEDDLLVARSEQTLAETKLRGTERLEARSFVSKAELKNEQLAYEKAALKVQTAQTALKLFVTYEFPKSAEEFVSKYEEALHGLDRARKEAVSKLAQAEAKLRSAEGRFRIEETQQRELQEQLEKCVIRALKPGLVVYGSGSDRRFYSEEQIREGATVRERQPIITIPDMSQLSVRVKIHESHIKKIRKGMKARIQVDAFPDQLLEGEVAKVAVLPDSQDRWMNPDLKVYQTTINIVGTREWLKPGMSSKVEILVKELTDVIYVPLQAVVPMEGKQYCYVLNGREPERRELTVGEFNDQFIEVKSGLREGERVLLTAQRPPETNKEEEVEAEKPEAAPAQPPAGAPASPPSDPGPNGTSPASPRRT